MGDLQSCCVTQVATPIFVAVMEYLSSFLIAASDRLFPTVLEISFASLSKDSFRTS